MSEPALPPTTSDNTGSKIPASPTNDSPLDGTAPAVQHVMPSPCHPFKRCFGALLAASLAACVASPDQRAAPLPPGCAQEYPVTLIPLAGDIADDEAEISGLAWYREQLLLLPQYPDFGRRDGDGRLFAIAKTNILAVLDGKTTQALTPQEIAVDIAGLKARIPGFQGFEALAVDGERAYLAIEAEHDGAMMGYLVSGSLQADLSRLRLNLDSLRPLPPAADIPNATNEAMLVADRRILSFYENNGALANPNARAYAFALPELTPLPPVAMPSLEYRLTAVTGIDSDGKFWAVNFFYPGDRNIYPIAADPLPLQYGQPASHAHFPQVERLVQMQYTPGQALRLTNTSPLYLRLDSPASRNWEGVVRLDQRGFLLATDRHPHTLLGFVATKDSGIK